MTNAAWEGVELGPVDASDVIYPGEGATLQGYLAASAGDGRLPAVLAIHANQGLTEHVRETARYLANEGYVALAPDLLSRLGGTRAFERAEDATRAIYDRTDFQQNVTDLLSALAFLRSHPRVDPARIGVIGWCMGGTYVWQVAVRAGDAIRAASPWYGKHAELDQIASISAPVFAVYAEHDERINAGIEPTERRMRELQKVYRKKIYPGSKHAFFNDHNPAVYHAEASRDAWADTLAFLAERLLRQPQLAGAPGSSS